MAPRNKALHRERGARGRDGDGTRQDRIREPVGLLYAVLPRRDCLWQGADTGGGYIVTRHKLAVVRRLSGSAPFALCNCGWQSEPLPTVEDVLAAWKLHIDCEEYGKGEHD